MTQSTKYKLLSYNGKEFVVESEADNFKDGLALLKAAGKDRRFLARDNGDLDLGSLTLDNIHLHSTQTINVPQVKPGLKVVK